MDKQQDVDNHDYMPEQYNVKPCGNQHEEDVTNADRSCTVVDNHRFEDDIDKRPGFHEHLDERSRLRIFIIIFFDS